MARSKIPTHDMSMLDESDPDYDYSDGPPDDEWMEAVPRDLSPEDEALLASANDEVCRRLGPDADGYLTDQIREALWNFYYDIDETLEYLKSLRKSTKPTASPDLLPTGRGKNHSGKPSSTLPTGKQPFPFGVFGLQSLTLRWSRSRFREESLRARFPCTKHDSHIHGRLLCRHALAEYSGTQEDGVCQPAPTKGRSTGWRPKGV